MRVPRIPPAAELWKRLLKALAGARRRLVTHAWTLLQQTAAATLAWVIATHLGDHQDPFFAPIAAVVALNTAPGERGLQSLRLLTGVVLGIVAGELTLSHVGGGYLGLAVSVFFGTATARALGGSRLVVGQAAAGAILTIASATAMAGSSRLIDALIGAGVALVFSQLLFAPEPVALLRRAEAEALEKMADGLELTSSALGGDAADAGEAGDRAMKKLRDLIDGLAEVGRARHVSSMVTQYTVTWRVRAAPLVQERENAGYLDLLGGSCFMLARTALAADQDERLVLAPSIAHLADILRDLSAGLGSRAERQHAADRVLDAVSALDLERLETEASGRDAVAALDMVAIDVLVFAGVEPAESSAAVHEGARRFKVAKPPQPPRVPVVTTLLRRWRGRRQRRIERQDRREHRNGDQHGHGEGR
ncbi:FUSC family protein [Nonomuraea cavernae]|uniref:FUSC family protein n=1 Tax=Nonomuraea cavernae TaxID=2045107 RepID=UPI0033F9D168